MRYLWAERYLLLELRRKWKEEGGLRLDLALVNVVTKHLVVFLRTIECYHM